MHRRRFLHAAAALALLAAPRALRALGRPLVRHPDPRPGITGANVLPPDRVTTESARDAYEAARKFPELLDGIYCHCDCAERHPELRSLLSCFETEMPMSCGICTGEARLAARLTRQGKTLDEIREEIDERFG